MKLQILTVLIILINVAQSKVNQTEINVNKCDELNPCLNSGKCVAIGDDYKCICHDIFSGYNCEYCKCFINSNQCSSFGNGLCRTKQTPKQNSN